MDGASHFTPELYQDIYPQYTCDEGMQSHCSVADYAAYMEQGHSGSSAVGW